MRIINAKIITMAGTDHKNGFIDFDGGVIIAIGDMSEAAAAGYAGEIMDARGALLLPGFIDAHCHLGMFGDSLGFEGDDGNEDTDPCTPQLRAIDAINPLDRCFEEALAAGVTTVVTGPGSANAISGQLAAVKTMGGRIDGQIVKAPVAIKFSLGENPKTVYHGKNQAPVTRMATAAIIREQLIKTQKYMDALKKAENDADAEEPEYDAKCEALIPLFAQGLPTHFHAHRADDIFTAVRIAREFGLNYSIVHCTAGHLIAGELAALGASALVGPLLCDRSKPELGDLTPATPAALQKAGVPIAIVTDHPVIPIQYLTLCAALAVREGLPRGEAMKAITIGAARICGIDGRVGSLEAGKDADMVMFDSDPLDLKSKPVAVFCGGKRYGA